MKKVLTAMVCLMMSIMMQAGDASRQEALEKAQQFMPNKEFKQQSDSRRKVSANGSQSSPYYVFNAENNGGFVIVSGDDRTEAILGYADKGELDVENAPDNVKWLLDYYAKVITALGELPETDESVSYRRKVSAKVSERKTIEPLVKTQWNQMDPYNKYCPEWIGTGLRYPTGCVAVAMAQIINYYRWPQGNTSALDAYISAENNIAMPALPPTSFDWDNMTDDDIARLMLYCGQSVKMQYDETGSGAYDDRVSPALIDIFGYNRGLRLISRDGYSDDEWEHLVYEELSANRPMYYSGEGNGGHAFVVDGYDNGRFHINWGWSGDLDGYYLLTGLTSDKDYLPYNKHQLACCCIRPAVEGANAKLSVMDMHCADNNLFDKVVSTRGNMLEDFPPIYLSCELANNVAHEAALYIGYGLFDGTDLVQVLSQEHHSFLANENYSFSSTITVKKNIQNKEYQIKAIYRTNKTDEWDIAEGANCNYIQVNVEETSLSLLRKPYYIDSENYEDYGVHTIDGVTYQLWNQYGNFIAEILPYKENGKYSGNIVVPEEVTYKNNTYHVLCMRSSAFANCDDMTSLSVAGAYGFDTRVLGCPQLTKIYLQDGVASWNTIYDCQSLEAVEISESFTTALSGGVFIASCPNLNTIRFKGETLDFNGVPNWEDESLPSLSDIYFPMVNPPVLSNNSQNVPANTNATIHIPIGTLKKYQQSPWKEWTFVEDLPIPNSDAVTWDYCHTDGENPYMGLGSAASDNNMEYAIFIPAEELNAYIGCKITQIEMYSTYRARNEDGGDDYQYVFVTKQGTDYLVKQPYKVVRGKWNTVELERPYIITGEAIFVGIGKHHIMHVEFTDDTYLPNALWARAMGKDYGCIWEPEKWDNLGKNRLYGHPFPLRFTIEGNNVPQGAVIRELAVAEGDGVNIQAVVRNRSLNIVKSYTVSWTTDDEQTGTQTFETNLLPNTTETISIPLPTSLGTGHHAVTFDIPTLDGQENALKGLNPPTIHLYNGAEAIVISSGNYIREYGEENPVLYDINGLTPNGTPEVECDATRFSSVGEYPITLKAGTITNENVVFVNGGSLTVTKAPLTVMANSYAIKQGTALPEFGFSCQGLKNWETEAVLKTMPTLTCSATSSNVLGIYDINIAGAEADNYDITHQNGVLQVSIPGDVTGTGKVDVQDATLTVNYILGNNGNKEEDYKFAVSDMNDDEVVDVFDVTGMIGAILSTEVSAKARKVSALQHPTVDEQLQVDDSADGLTLNIERPERFTSFQMDVEVPDGVELTGARLTDDETGHAVRFAQVGKNRYRVLGLSMKSERLKAATSGLLELSLSDVGSVQIDDIMFVTPKGEAVRFGAPSYNNATGIEGVTTSQIEEDIYDLLGRKMSVRREQLPKGVYIINQQKVVIK